MLLSKVSLALDPPTGRVEETLFAAVHRILPDCSQGRLLFRAAPVPFLTVGVIASSVAFSAALRPSEAIGAHVLAIAYLNLQIRPVSPNQRHGGVGEIDTEIV